MNNFTVIKNSKITIIFIFMVMISFKSFSQTPDVDGQWSGVIPFDIVPVAIANLPDGRILTWSSKSKFSFGGNDGFTWTQIFDPTIGIDGGVLPEIVTNTNHDMFCPGINNLADGRIMATGGSSAGKATIYDPTSETWVAANNMNYARGYQGAVTLSDGSVFTIGGSWSGGTGVKDAELWTEETGWTILSGLEKTVLYNAQDDIYETQAGSYRLDNHAWLWAAPNGKIFHAGPGETMHWIDVTGNGSSTVVGQRGTVARPDIYAMNGTTVMFDVGKILKFGGSYTYSGGTPSSDNAYVIDINDENNVTVTLTGNDAEEGRIFPTSVVLPNGEVMIIGGMDTSVPFSDNGAHLSLEIYNPDTNLFRTVVDMAEERTYHSAGVLMNDGRVFMGGGGLCGGCSTNHANAEIYSPPYLFDTNGDLAVRPTLSAPNVAYYDNTFSVVASPDVTDFAFVRLSSATHSVNNEQRRVPVSYTGSNGSFQLNMPNANIMPPGYYMLFAMNADGVPSISEAVLIGNLNLENNLALNQPTSQSSLFPNGESFKAVDGNTNGDFNANPNSVTHTAADDNSAWWRVDLGDDYQYALDGIRIYNRSTFPERLVGATVYIGNIDSTDPADYTEVATLTADFTQILTENMGIARFVMIRQSGILSLAEVEVFGQGINCPVEGTICDDGDANTSNDVENGDCSCEGTIISCDNIEIVAQVDGESFIGETEITVTEDEDITLSLNLDDVAYTIEDPDGNILGSNSINDIAFDQSGLYTLTSSVTGPISQNLTVIYVNSENTATGNLATNTVDGDPNTIWHTQFIDVDPDTPYPHEIQLDLGIESNVSGFTYLPRPGGVGADQNGRVADYEIYVSNSTTDWGTPVNNGTWANTAVLKTVNFPEVQGRYLRFVALSEVNNMPWASAAEINVLGTPVSVCVKTIQINVVAKTCDELAVVYEINGESGTGESEITVTEGDDIGLFINSDIVTYTVEAPDATVLPGNVINNIGLGQSGLYTVTSVLDVVPGNYSDPILVSVSDEHPTGDNDGLNAIDGNNNTFWHSDYSTNPDVPHPHSIVLDLGDNSSINGIEYLPRQAGVNGRIANYEIYVSNSTTNWGAPVTTGTWPNSAALQTVNFTAVQGKYLRLVALSEVNGQPWTSIAELDVLRPGPTVYFVNSEETAGPNNVASNALDGDPNTIWHTQFSDVDPDTPYPHEFQIDLGIESDVSGLEYLPRQTGVNGTIAQYEIYVSNDPNNWGSPVNAGTWANSNALKTVSFTETQGRYVRLLALSEVNGAAWASAAEINIVRTVPTACIKTIQINVDTVTTYTYDNGWLPSDPTGVANFNDEIIVDGGDAIISSNTICNTLIINPGGSVTVNAGVTLTANTTTLSSISTSYSSLIVDGTVEGEIKYERFVNANSGGNDLISPPLAGQTWENFRQSETNAADLLDNGATDPTAYAFGPFDKIADSYLNYTDAEAPGLILESGRGYRAGTDVGTTLTFTGTVPTTQITADIINTGAVYPDWNLIGNPYPSYLDMNLFLTYVLDDTTDPVTTNLSILENISGIYGYAGSIVSNKWDVITLANASAVLMAPGQGFFVAANDTFVIDYDIVFDPSMRASGSDDDFIAGRNANVLTFLKLNAGRANADYTTEFYFNANASRGLDLGYDGKILGNVAPNFAIYSHLVEDNTGLPIALQALNPSDLENTIIPLGVNANQGEQITFSISESTLPSDVEVYLEDNVTNTVTLLNTGDYTVTPSTNLNGTGRFYLRISSTVLSVDNNDLDYLQIYTTANPKSLIIKGTLKAATTVHLYDIQGRLVLNKKIDQFNVLNTVDISMIGTGVYIVKVFNDSQSKAQKLVIK